MPGDGKVPESLHESPACGPLLGGLKALVVDSGLLVVLIVVSGLLVVVVVVVDEGVHHDVVLLGVVLLVVALSVVGGQTGLLVVILSVVGSHSGLYEVVLCVVGFHEVIQGGKGDVLAGPEDDRLNSPKCDSVTFVPKAVTVGNKELVCGRDGTLHSHASLLYKSN